MTEEKLNDAALACARRMIEYCEHAKHYGHYTGYTNANEALAGVARREAGFGDLCDDNIFIHEVLSGKGLIPCDVESAMKSDEAMHVWELVAERLDWAAGQLLQQRRTK